MCRMLAYVGSSEAELGRLYSALVGSARHDEIRAGFSSKHDHRDGWGYAICASNGLFHYRTGRPIFEDKHKLPKLKGPIYAVFHARSAADDSPLGGSMFSHPFSAASDRELLFLCQNGTIPRRMLPKGFPERRLGTEYVLDRMVRFGVRKGMEAITKEFRGTNTNWLVLRIARDGSKPSVYCMNRYVKTDNAYRNEYYRMYRKMMAHGKAVFSSTLMRNGMLGGSPLAYCRLISV